MPNTPTRHPEDDLLIGFAGGDLTDGDIRDHLKDCAECRTRVDDIRATIANYAVHVADLKRDLPPPPQPWFDVTREMRRLDAESRGRVLRFPAPRIWWAAAAAAVAAAIIIPNLTSPPAVSAAEVLEKAVARERQPSPRRQLQVRIRNLMYTRPAKRDAKVPLQVADARTEAELHRKFDAARYNWDHPLSASSFAAWRNQLSDRQDQVSRLQDEGYRIETTSASNELAHVALTLRGADYQPVSETFRFRDNSTIEIADAGDRPEPAARQEQPPEPALAHPEPVSLTAGEELRVIAALNKTGADLGEPVEIARDEEARKLQVTATGLSPARQEQLRSALKGFANVELRFESPQAIPHAASEQGTEIVQKPSPLQKRLEDYFGRRTLVDDYVNNVIESSERILSRAHALRALADRFPPAREPQLTPSEQSVLDGLVHQHIAALRAAAEELPGKLQPLIGATPEAAAETCSPWQACAHETVEAAQQLDAALSRALASAQPSPSPERAEADAREAALRFLRRVRAWR